MNAPLRTTLSTALLAASIGSLVAAPTQAATPTAKPITVSDVVYSHEEMFGFDIQKYLSKRAPRLVRQSESISHWAGYSGISPKVLIALMEQESGIADQGHPRRSRCRSADHRVDRNHFTID